MAIPERSSKQRPERSFVLLYAYIYCLFTSYSNMIIKLYFHDSYLKGREEGEFWAYHLYIFIHC